MKGTLLESRITDSGAAARLPRLVIGALVAVLVTGLLFGGYLILRRRHQQQIRAAEEAQAPKLVEQKGPAKAQILVDEALLKGDQTVLGGTVKNISTENLSSLSVQLELVRRKGGQLEKTSVQVQPNQLVPQQEGRYSLLLRSADYRGAKLVGLKSSESSAQLVYVAALGQKRPPEKLEAKTIIVGRPAPKKGDFLNTPDTPGRVP